MVMSGASGVGQKTSTVIHDPAGLLPPKTGQPQTPPARVDSFARGASEPAAAPPSKGTWSVLKDAATSRDAKIAGTCAAVALGLAFVPVVGEIALLLQLNGLLVSGLGASVFGRVALEDAMAADKKSDAAQAPDVNPEPTAAG